MLIYSFTFISDTILQTSHLNSRINNKIKPCITNQQNSSENGQNVSNNIVERLRILIEGFAVPEHVIARNLLSQSTTSMNTYDDTGNRLTEEIQMNAEVFEFLTSDQTIQYEIYPRVFTAIGLKEQKLYKKIRTQLKKIFPDTQIYFYGSRFYCAADKDSDLNIFVDFENCYNILREKSKMKLKAVKAKDIFEQSPYKNDWEITADLKERFHLISLLTAFHKNSSINCIFSFGTGVAVEATKLLDVLFSIQPVCRHLVIYLKFWQNYLADVRNASFKLSTYQWSMLVVALLQIKGILPSVSELQKNKKLTYCGDVVVSYNRPSFVETIRSLRSFLCDFFDFYGNIYKSNKNVVSAHYGQLMQLDISYTDSNDNLLSPLEKKLKSRVQAANQKLWKTPFRVQDIFYQYVNVTYDISAEGVECFQKFCRLTASALKKDNFI